MLGDSTSSLAGDHTVVSTEVKGTAGADGDAIGSGKVDVKGAILTQRYLYTSGGAKYEGSKIYVNNGRGKMGIRMRPACDDQGRLSTRGETFSQLWSSESGREQQRRHVLLASHLPSASSCIDVAR